MIDVTEKCAFVHFAVRMFSPEREIGKRDKAGAVIRTEKVQIISPKTLNPLTNAKNIGERACRRFGTRFEALNSWLVPLCNIDKLIVELKKSVAAFEFERSEFILHMPANINAQIAANPNDEMAIRSVTPSAADMEKSIRVSWVRHNLDMDEIENYGLTREFSGIAEQAAWEIAQDVKVSTGSGSKYSKNTLEVLSRAADKAESFGFLSESLAAIKPAVDQLKAGLTNSGFTPADRLIIGAMIAFLSDHKKVVNEGRRIDSVFNQTLAELHTPASHETGAKVDEVNQPAAQSEHAEVKTASEPKIPEVEYAF